MVRSALLTFGLARPAFVGAQSLVQNLAFTDNELTRNVLGGSLSWDPPSDMTNVNTYAAYIATSSSGAGASSVGQVAVGTNAVTVSTFTNSGSYTHMLVYTKDGSGIQASTGAAAVITDRSIPDYDVQSLAFTDTDTRVGFIEGVVTWTQPADITFVSHYAAFTAPASTGLDRTQLGILPVGTNQVSVPPNTVASTATHIWVYSQNSLGRKDPPAVLAAQDLAIPPPSVVVSNLAFYDDAIDGGKIAGSLAWSQPTDISLVATYDVYLAGGGNPLQSVSSSPVGTNLLTIVTEISLGSYDQFRVYTSNPVGQATSYGSLTIVDRAVPSVSVSGISFTDNDNDGGEIGGVVHWSPPGDVSTVTYFTIYLAEDGVGARKTKTGSDVPVGSNQLTIPNNTVIGFDTTFLLVYTANSVGEQRTPSAMQFTDVGVSFLDDDLLEGRIGGIVKFTPYPNPGAIQRIRVYLSEDAQGTGKQEVANDMQYVSLVSNEQRNIVLSLVNSELVLGQNYTRHSPAGEVVVASANARILDASDMTGRPKTKRSLQLLPLPVYITFGKDVLAAASKYSLLSGIELLNFTSFLVLAEASNGAIMSQQAGAFVDRIAPVEGVSNITFSDHDFARNKIGGVVRWEAPSDVSRVVTYRVYLSNSEAGGPAVGDLPIVEVPVGQNEGTIPMGTNHRKWIVVSAWGKDVSQIYPPAVRVSDVALYNCLRAEAEEALNVSSVCGI
eukprot:gnl/MRDRNA2_/MRDRNA2_176781_c0_seq1.p1 gnl/MRDRNA2_/MRDRNA2_176781_c0~~gnl/MRDRNA2_/MRDRNA2_176781_c0_seq1.p1  ORF type:complete len:725 (+),score=111.92 gnl/MRDRNA2_/MRDRNA2_176781_c0_seq1:143-2317(+)